jgi:hypothetical protein
MINIIIFNTGEKALNYCVEHYVVTMNPIDNYDDYDDDYKYFTTNFIIKKIEDSDLQNDNIDLNYDICNIFDVEGGCNSKDKYFEFIQLYEYYVII